MLLANVWQTMWISHWHLRYFTLGCQSYIHITYLEVFRKGSSIPDILCYGSWPKNSENCLTERFEISNHVTISPVILHTFEKERVVDSKRRIWLTSGWFKQWFTPPYAFRIFKQQQYKLICQRIPQIFCWEKKHNFNRNGFDSGLTYVERRWMLVPNALFPPVVAMIFSLTYREMGSQSSWAVLWACQKCPPRNLDRKAADDVLKDSVAGLLPLNMVPFGERNYIFWEISCKAGLWD